MLKSTEKIIDSHLHQHLIQEQDIACLFEGTKASKYALVNKALKQGELIRLSRGKYVVADKYLAQPFSRLYLANRLVPHSYVSAESALSFYGWIPEGISQVTSVCAHGRSRDYDTPLGVFDYLVPPVNAYYFYAGVNLEKLHNQWVYIASPLRALIDYVYWHRVHEVGIDWALNSLRVDEDNLHSIAMAEVKLLSQVYPVSYVNKFLQEFLDAKQ